jgi:hypothetical protein
MQISTRVGVVHAMIVPFINAPADTGVVPTAGVPEQWDA